MEAREFIEYFKFPYRLNADTLKTLQDLTIDFPYCSGIYTLLAKNHFVVDTAEKSQFLKLSAVYANDRKKLFNFINDIPDENIILNHIPYSIEMTENIEKGDDISLEIAKKESGSKDDLIEKFIREKPGISFKNEDIVSEEEEYLTETSDNENDNEYLTETLTKLYWKQGDRVKAIRCYEKLSLKYPEKSSYFAAQIEKVKKEIL
jgi:hypothetical protein